MKCRDERSGVLYLAPWVDLGGSDKGTVDWFRHLDKARWAPHLICTQPSPNRWLRAVEPYAEEIWNLPEIMAGREYPEFILGYIASRDIRVVHVMHSRLGMDLLPDISALPNPPATVIQLHVEEPGRGGYPPYAADRFAQLADAFSVSSEHLAATMRGYDVPASKLHVIPTGVDGEHEWAPELHEPVALDPAVRHHVLWPGRFTHQKDPETAVEATALAVERGVDMALHMVGDGELAGAVRARSGDLGLNGRLQLHPPSRELGRWYSACDVTLMTSRYEGIPYVVFESFAMERPVIAPALPGNREFFDSRSGVLVAEDADARTYADALEELLRDEPRRRSMGRRARERMLGEHSCAQMAARHGELYERLLRDREATEPDAAPLPEPWRLPREPVTTAPVTVIVTNYELGRYLHGAIRSVREQTLEPAQVIVVDDGSRGEETLTVLAELEGAPDLELVRLDANHGPSHARNVALERATGDYVIPLDADDELLPGALASMVAQLSSAPEDVGFVYPNQQHIGTRTDYVRVPTYNLALLRNANDCHTTSLFDRRVFDLGARYWEERGGHEDWNLVLALAVRGVYGVPATEPTLLYRKRGFSRLSSRSLEAETPEAMARRLYPELYDRANRVKPLWAPALSVVLAGAEWSAAAIECQRCRDFEVIRADDESHAALAAAIRAAKGRWVLVAGPEAGPALEHAEVVELVLRVFWNSGRLGALALATGVDGPFRYAQLAPPLAPEVRPVAVAWERIPEERGEAARFGDAADPVADIVDTLQREREIQWRTIR